MKKKMMKLLSAVAILTIGSLMLTGCATEKKSTPEVDITTVVSPSDGLDLKLVGQLFQDGAVKDAEGLEKVLNKDGGINNLDLDSDGSVDYINVSENDADASSSVKSFDLTTGQDTTITHIATVEVEKGAGKDEYNIHMSGSETMYGSGHHYNSSFHSTGDMLFYAWLFSPRPRYYHSPYYGGHYPSYYGGGRTVVNNVTYVNRTTTQRTKANSNKSFTKSATSSTKVKSVNKGKASKSTRTSLNNHKTQVKKMAVRKKEKAAKAKVAKAKAAKAKKARSTRSKSRSSSTRSRSSSSRSRSGGGRRSDANYKTDVADYNNGLETVMQLNGVTYDWNPESFEEGEFNTIVGGEFDASRQVGFIAQDVEKVIPEIIDTDEHGLVVNYDLLVPVLVEAIQAQQLQIEELQAQVETLK